MHKSNHDPHTSNVFFQMFSMVDLTSRILNITCPTSEIHFPAGQAYIHIIQQADCLLLNGEFPLYLSAGDIIVLPRSKGHSIEQAKKDYKQDDAWMETLPRIITATFKLEGLYGETIGHGLPDYIQVPHLPTLSGITEWLPMTVAAIERELDTPSLGREIMLSKIIDLLLIWCIRYWLATDTLQHKGWINALKDASVGQALSLLHADPSFKWSITLLAKHTRQSRSNFARKFVELVGVPPMQYLTNWRMQLASRLILTTDYNISQIAERVGYDSQAAFSRVFRRTFIMSPSEYREAMLQNYHQ